MEANHGNGTRRRYGWIPDLPDHRDEIYEMPRRAAKLPTKVDLRPLCPPVYDQGSLGSCTANALAGAFAFDQRRQKLVRFPPSRLFVYYNERVLEGTTDSDSGAMLRDGMKAIAAQGFCSESIWPYRVERFRDKPSPLCYRAALGHKALQYSRVPQDLASFKTCLAAGFPFVFGFTAYDSFESDEVARTGVVPMLAQDESVLGGHAVLAVGYDDTSQRFFVRNSWGAGWGQAGHFTMPYAYLTNTNLAADFWTVRLVR